MNKHNIQTIDTNNGGLQLLTIPTRVHGFMVEKAKEAVDVLNKEKGEGEQKLTVAELIRISLAEKVASVLNEDVAELPPVVRGRGGSMVSQLAKELGISKEQLEQKAAELIAAQRFGYKGPGNELLEKVMSGDVPVVGGPRHQSSPPPAPVREASKSGQHQIAVTRNLSNGRTQRRTG
jgi:hypothetical protein